MMPRILLILMLVCACLMWTTTTQDAGTASAAPALSVRILVPPSGLWPFSVMQRSITGNTATDYRLDFYRPAQANPSNPTNATGHVMLTGNQGRTSYDGRVLYSTLDSSCAADGTYCAWSNYPDAKPTSEAFKGLQVGDDPAMVTHILCCNGHHWSVIWYSSAVDTTYELLLSEDVADEISPMLLSEDNRGTAESVATIAAKLVPLR